MKTKLLRVAVCGLVLLAPTACADDSKVEDASSPGTASSSPEASAVESLISQGITQGNAGEYDQAKATFEEALELDSNNKYAWFNLGYIAQTEDKPEEATDHYDQAIELDPGFTSAMYNKAIILEAQNPEAAVGLYEQIIEIDPKASTTFVRLGLMQLKLGDPAAASRSFERALEIDPGLRGEVPAEYRGEQTSPGPR